MTLKISLVDVSESYFQSFYVVAASGDPLLFDSATGSVENFRVPAGYTQAGVKITGGGGSGGGGGGTNTTGTYRGGGGGGGGGGADISGTFTVLEESVLLIRALSGGGPGTGGAGTTSGTGTTGSGGVRGGDTFVSVTYNTVVSSLRSRGGALGGGGAGGSASSGGAGGALGAGGTTVVSGISTTYLTLTNGTAGSAGVAGGNGSGGTGGSAGGNGSTGGNGGTSADAGRGNDSSTGTPSSFTFTLAVPAATPAPTGLSAIDISSSSIRVQWNNVVNPSITGFKTYYSTTSGQLSNEVGPLSYTASPQTRLFTSLTPSTQYYINIVNTGPGGDSTPTQVSATTTSSTPAPTVSNLAVTNVTASSFRVTYSSTNATSFVFYNNSSIITPDTSGTGFGDFTGQTSNTPFEMYIIASGPGGSTSVPGVKLQFYTLLDAPQNLVANDISQTSLILTWDLVGGATNYVLDISGGGLPGPNWDSFNMNSTGTGISNMDPYTYYTLSLRATSVNANTSAPTSITIRTLPNPPAPPTANMGGLVSTTATTATIQWDNPNDPSLTGFKVYHATTAVLSNEQDVSPFDLSYTILGLAPATAYYFNVKFVNAGGTSDPLTSYIEGTTQPPEPIQYSPLGPTLPLTVPAGYNLLEFILVGGGAGGSTGENTMGVTGGSGGSGGGAGAVEISSTTVNQGQLLSISILANISANNDGDPTVLSVNGFPYTALGGTVNGGGIPFTPTGLDGGAGGGGADGEEITDLLDPATTYKYGEGGGGGGGNPVSGQDALVGPGGAKGEGQGNAEMGNPGAEGQSIGGAGGQGGKGFYLVKLSYVSP